MSWINYFKELFFVPTVITIFVIIATIGLSIINYLYMGSFTDPNGFSPIWVIWVYTFCVAFIALIRKRTDMQKEAQ